MKLMLFIPLLLHAVAAEAVRPMNVLVAGASFLHCSSYTGCSTGPRIGQHLVALGTIQNSANYSLVGYMKNHEETIEEVQELFDDRDYRGNTECLDAFVFSWWDVAEAAYGPIQSSGIEAIASAKRLVNMVRERSSENGCPEAAVFHVHKPTLEPLLEPNVRWFPDSLGLTSARWDRWNDILSAWLELYGVKTIRYANLLWRPTENVRTDICDGNGCGLPDYHIDSWSSYLVALRVHTTLMRWHICVDVPEYSEPVRAYCDVFVNLPTYKLELDYEVPEWLLKN